MANTIDLFIDLGKTVSKAGVQTRWWNPVQRELLNHYVERAQARWKAGNTREAVEAWTRALSDLSGLPAPRQIALRQQVRAALLTQAQSILQGENPSVSEALKDIRDILRICGPDPFVLKGYGLLRHFLGHPDEAKSVYGTITQDLPAEDLALDCGLRYARHLARLQISAARVTDVSDAPPQKRGPHMVWNRQMLHPDGLDTMAWGRLLAMESLLEGDVKTALAKFPRPQSSRMPQEWALEGAMLACLARDWVTAFLYVQGAQAAGVEPNDAYYSAVKMVAGLHILLDPAGQVSSDTKTDVEQQLRRMSLLLRSTKRQQTTVANWREVQSTLAQWKHRDLLHRARAALSCGNRELTHTLISRAVLLQPRSVTSKQLRIWLSCARGNREQVCSLFSKASSQVGLGSGVQTLRLIAWAAECLGEPGETVKRLTKLLDRYPDDLWGLARWKYWMLHLGSQAMERRSYKQALLHFASILLYLPDDRDGWARCGRANMRARDSRRATDCLAQSRRISSSNLRHDQLDQLAGLDTVQAGYRLLDFMLEAVETDAPQRFHITVADDELLRAVLVSFQGADRYLAALIGCWAADRAESSSVSAG